MKAKQGSRSFPERKILETFLDFAAPLLSAVPKRADKREYENVLKIAFVVWNAVVYADATNDDRHLSEIRRLLGQDVQSRLICEQMISRKRELFGKDYRLVGDHKITMEKGGFKLWAEARTPYPDNGNKAGPRSPGDPSTRKAADIGTLKK